MTETTEKVELDKAITTTTVQREFKKEVPALLAELLFIVLPFIVIATVNLTNGQWTKLMQTSNWALASTLLFGQTIVKIVMGVASREQSFAHQNYGFLIALIIVLGLVPSIVILTIFEMSSKISPPLMIIQFVLLALAVIVFLVFGTAGQILSANAFRYKMGKAFGLNKKQAVLR